MATHDRNDRSASRIWRTVVFAGAMLGTPTIAGADAPAVPAQPAGKVMTKPAPPPKVDPVQDKSKKLETLDGERKALIAQLVTVDPTQIDKLRKDIVAKDAAIKTLVDELVALRKPRPRTPPPEIKRPVGRGFVLA